MEEALDLDLHYYSSQEDDSPQPLRGKAVATGAVSASDSLGNGADLQLEGHRIRSVVVRPATHRVSYKEALLRGRAFKTANNQRRSSHGRFEWQEVGSRKKGSNAGASVWSRLGAGQQSVFDRLGKKVTSIFDKLGPRTPMGENWLDILKTKVAGRCFNCFARDHRIAECRDPPKCILCSRSGHKARFCRATVTSTPAPVLVPSVRPAAAIPRTSAPGATQGGAGFSSSSSSRTRVSAAMQFQVPAPNRFDLEKVRGD